MKRSAPESLDSSTCQKGSIKETTPTEVAFESASTGVKSQEHVHDKDKRKDFLRKRNALYARRKYARKKIEADVLQEQCLQLEEQNHFLKLEENRLRSLLDRANQVVQMHHAAGYPIQGPMLTSGISGSGPAVASGPLASLWMQELSRQQAQTAMLGGHGFHLPGALGMHQQQLWLGNMLSGTLPGNAAALLANAQLRAQAASYPTLSVPTSVYGASPASQNVARLSQSNVLTDLISLRQQHANHLLQSQLRGDQEPNQADPRLASSFTNQGSKGG